jgi:hypothetical protein
LVGNAMNGCVLKALFKELCPLLSNGQGGSTA